jgi:predicted AlkP superfamily phosphohydrolase/phosphomutase
VHTAGHKLWDLTNVVGPYDESQSAEMLDSLRRVYAACDAAIGSLLAAAGDDVNVIVCAIHGMEHNITRNEILPEMLRRVVADEHVGRMPPGRKDWLPLLRQWVPANWRHAVKSRLPMWAQDWLTFFWRAGRGRWEDKPAFALPADGQGMIRINLRGRESAGVVNPGPEYEALSSRIAEGLLTFVDADSGEPLIQNIHRLEAVFNKQHSAVPLDCYPDLTVDWAPTPARAHRAVYSARYGTIPWPTPHRNPEGRSGNHRMEGFMIAAGPDIKSGTIKDARMIDLAPTILALLGRKTPEPMDGKPLDILVRP